MSTSPASPPATEASSIGRLGTHHLVLMIVAAAAPLGVAVGNLPAGLVLGNGVRLPAAFLVAALVIACVAVGFIRLAREVRADGGFVDLVRAGLGDGSSLAVAYLTGVAYWTGSLSLAASFGYFSGLIGGTLGVDVPWWVFTFAAFALVLFLGRRAADLSAKMLLLLLAAEVAVLLVLNVAILIRHGAAALPLEVFSPENVFSGNIGPAVLVGFTSFIGVESAILYTRETRDPRRSMPRATFAAIGVIGTLYVLTAWLVIGGLGTATAVEQAGELEGELVFALGQSELGDTFLALLQIVFVTSLLACFVALHNASSRYTQTLASRGALPRRLAVVHPAHLAPSAASTALVGVGVVLFIVFAALGAAPYIGIATSLTGLFTLGIVLAQAIVSIAVVVYFRRAGTAPSFATFVAPVLGAIGALLASLAIVTNYSVLTGSESAVARLVPLILVVVFLAGYAVHARTRGREGDRSGR